VLALLDATGLSIRGPGSWRKEKPGAHEKQRRSYRKLHLLVDLETLQVLAACTTDPGAGDGAQLPRLLSALPEGVPVVATAADGAYDTEAVYAAAERHGIDDVRIPPSSRAKPWKESVPGAWIRNRHFQRGDRDRDFEAGGKAWKEAVQYHVRSLVETANSRLEALSGNRLKSRSGAGQDGEIFTLLWVLNEYAAFGMPQRETRAYALPAKAA
jgi:hypothetical protein